MGWKRVLLVGLLTSFLLGSILFIPIRFDSKEDNLLANKSTQLAYENELPDVPFVGELDSGVTGYAKLSSGFEYWNISVSQDTIQVVIDLKCGGNDFDFWLYNNRYYFSGSSAPGDDHKVTASIPFGRYGVWQIYVFPGENYNGPSEYNLTVTVSLNPFNDDPIEGDPRILTTEKYRFSNFSVAPGSMIETSTNETVIASSCTYWYDVNHTEYDRYLSILKLNSLGQLMWNKTYKSDLRGHPRVCETFNSNLVVAANSWGVNDSFGRPLLYRIDQEGELDWLEEFGEEGWYVYNIDSCSDGTILVVGGQSIREDDHYFSIGWAINLFENGTQRWTRRTNDTEFSKFFSADTCRHMNILTSDSLTNGGVALGGFMNPVNGSAGGWIAIMNETANIQYSLELPEDIVLEIQELDENRLIVIGESYADGFEIYLKHISLEGSIIHETKIPYQFRFLFEDVVRHNDTSLIFMLTDSGGGPLPPSTCIIFKTDLNGTILWSLDDFHANHRYVSLVGGCADGRVLLVGWDTSYLGGLNIWVATVVDYPQPPPDIQPESVVEIMVIGVVGGTITIFAVAIVIRSRSTRIK